MSFSPCCGVLCAVIVFFLSGCAGTITKPLSVCPGKSNAAEALDALQSQSQNKIPLFARGNCSIKYYENNEEKKQHLSIKVFLIKPPSEIYIQASAGVVDKAVVLGSNAKEFWLEAKPEQISKYWWGLWSEQNHDAGIMINPRTLLEALGIAEIDTDEEGWSLSNEGAFDVLTKTSQNATIKKIYIYCCDYRIRKIEYFDNHGVPSAVAQLDDYRELSQGLFIPFKIVINSMSEIIEDSLVVNLTLESVKPATEKQQKFSIVRSQPKGFDHIYRVINGQPIEQ